jgi:photosystem II stability/assembly factor-like uncharacterized protein
MKSLLMTIITVIAILVLIATYVSAQWIPVPSPGEFDGIEFFLPGEDQIYVGTLMGKVYGSSDHGNNWTEIAGGLAEEYAPVQGMVVVGNHFIMSRSSFGDHNYRSTFDGEQWSPWEPLDYQESEIWSFAVIGDILFAILAGGSIHRSDDYGLSWTAVTAPSSDPVWKIFTHENRLFASLQVVNSGQIYRSDDFGQTWVQIGTGLGSSQICSHIHWQGQLLVCVYHMGGVGTFWSSPDFGNSWNEITTLPTTYNINGMAVADDGRLAIGASSGYPDYESIWLSSDLVAWEGYTGDLPQGAWSFNELVAHDGWFFKTGGSVTPYRAPHPVLSTVGDGPADRLLVKLQAFPNPFNPQTTIRFELADAGWVDLSIYDLMGRRVATLHNGQASAGTNEFTWLAHDGQGRPLPSGVYLARLQTDTLSSSQKLMLVE